MTHLDAIHDAQNKLRMEDILGIGYDPVKAQASIWAIDPDNTEQEVKVCETCSPDEMCSQCPDFHAIAKIHGGA